MDSQAKPPLAILLCIVLPYAALITNDYTHMSITPSPEAQNAAPQDHTGRMSTEHAKVPTTDPKPAYSAGPHYDPDLRVILNVGGIKYASFYQAL